MKKIKDYGLTLLIILLGNFIFAFGVMAFIEQNDLITGGVTGIALFIHYITGLSTSIFVFILNVFFFLLGWIFLGKKFAASIIISTLFYPLCVLILENIPLKYFKFDEIWLSIICAGFFCGLGIGMVVRVGATTGGLDVPCFIINKYFPFISFGSCVVFVDIISVLFQAFVPEVTLVKIFYAIFIAVIYSFVIDRVLLIGKNRIELKIISKKQEEIREAILNKIDRGLTLLHSTTGYLKEELNTILTIVDVRELTKIKKMIYDIDQNAFIVISKVNEVKGRGFDMEKSYDYVEKE